LYDILVCDLIDIIRRKLIHMANYKPDLSCQSKFTPIDFSQQIIPRHLWICAYAYCW